MCGDKHQVQGMWRLWNVRTGSETRKGDSGGGEARFSFTWNGLKRRDGCCYNSL